MISHAQIRWRRPQHGHRVEVERGGGDRRPVGGLVLRLLLEVGRQIAVVEVVGVHHDAPGDLLHPVLLHLAHQLVELGGAEARVAAPAHVQVALEHALRVDLEPVERRVVAVLRIASAAAR
jgi:hypothetical protein